MCVKLSVRGGGVPHVFPFFWDTPKNRQGTAVPCTPAEVGEIEHVYISVRYACMGLLNHFVYIHKYSRKRSNIQSIDSIQYAAHQPLFRQTRYVHFSLAKEI